MEYIFFMCLLLFVNSSFEQSTNELSIQPISGNCSLGEGPHWDEEKNVLYFVDIIEHKIFCWNPKNNKLTHAYIKDGPVGFATPVFNKQNTFVAGVGTKLIEIIWDPSTDDTNPKTRVITNVEDSVETRINDGKVDPKGRLWAGTMGEKNGEFLMEKGSLYRFDMDGKPTKMVGSVGISNGLAWSQNNDSFYYIDSLTRQVSGFDFNLETGNISNRRKIFNLEEHNIPGFPDGMTIDANGNLWVAVYDGGRVLQIDPISGKLLRTIDMPASKITSVAFGGPSKNILFVTSAKDKLSEADAKKQPLAGATFSVDGLGISGTSMLSAKLV